MFVRVKGTPNSPRKSVQIVENFRISGKVKQKIVKHIGVALDDSELEELKSLAHSIKRKLEHDLQLPLYSVEDIEKLQANSKNPPKVKNSSTPEIINAPQSHSLNLFDLIDETQRADYNVNLLDIQEEDRVIKGIHDIYGKLYDELGFNKVLPNPARNVSSTHTLKEIVLSRVANPDSKRESVRNLEANFGVKLDLNSVYKMMDKLGDNEVLKLNKLVYTQTKQLFRDKIDVVYFDATTLYFESFKEDEFKKNGYSKEPLANSIMKSSYFFA